MNELETTDKKWFERWDLADNHAEASRKHRDEAIKLYIEVGGWLKAKKEALGHGNWVPWLEENGRNQRSTYRYISANNNKENYKSGMTLLELAGEVKSATVADLNDENPPESQQTDISPEQKEYSPEMPTNAHIEKESEIEDVTHQEIEAGETEYDKQFMKEHTPPEVTKKNNMPDTYYLLCDLEKIYLIGQEIGPIIVGKREEMDRVFSPNFPEWQPFIDAYFEWFETIARGKPMMAGREWALLKKIIIYMRTLGTGDALANWQSFLGNWKRLDKYLAGQTSIYGIYNNMNKILTQLQDGQQKSTNQFFTRDQWATHFLNRDQKA